MSVSAKIVLLGYEYLNTLRIPLCHKDSCHTSSKTSIKLNYLYITASTVNQFLRDQSTPNSLKMFMILGRIILHLRKMYLSEMRSVNKIRFYWLNFIFKQPEETLKNINSQSINKFWCVNGRQLLANSLFCY